MLTEKNKQAAVVLLVSIFLLMLVRTAWISDDAAITLRTVLNFINGYGPTFNIDERVQAYTHPLWFFLISGLSLVVGNVFTATFLLSFGVSVLALWLLLTKVATSPAGAIVAGVALVLSKAYLDFATSGLENPLSHLLILAAVLMAVRSLEHAVFRDLALFFLTCSLIYLNRPDLLALVFPLSVLVAPDAARKNAGQLLRAALLGAVPIVGWTLFSIYYYGFPFPNTAYAKLGAGIALGERLQQGWVYVLHSVGTDPLTIAFIVAGAAIGLAGPALNVSLAAGMLLYLTYVLSIGGDFMEGRFFTAPLLLAAILVSRCRLDRTWLAALGAGVLLLGMLNARATLFSDATYDNTPINKNGIADERGFYYQRFGLMSTSRNNFATPEWVVRERRVEVTCGGLGYASVYSGPSVHFIDECALADPLLARLPAKYDPHWRIGHFTRQLPTDYRDSLVEGRNMLADPATHAYYDSIRTITRAPLNDPARLREIVRFNLGKVARPDWDMYRTRALPISSRTVEASAAQLGRPVDGGPWNADGNVRFSQVLEVALPVPQSFREIDLSVDHNDTYRIDGLTDVGWQELTRVAPTSRAGMVRHRLTLEREALAVRRIRVTALSGDGYYSLGHLLLR